MVLRRCLMLYASAIPEPLFFTVTVYVSSSPGVYILLEELFSVIVTVGVELKEIFFTVMLSFLVVSFISILFRMSPTTFELTVAVIV